MDAVFIPWIIMKILLIAGTNAMDVRMNTDISTSIGTTNVVLRCHIEPKPGDHLNGIGLHAKNETTDEYFSIAGFYPPSRGENPKLTPSGEYLAGRVSLTNPTDNFNVATLSFDELQCEDDTYYKCEVNYDRDGKFTTAVSSPTKITVTTPPSKPDSITITPSSGIAHGQYVTFLCTGNVGNPPGHFIWRKHQTNKDPVTFSGITTKTEEVTGSCTYHGTSNLTIEITDMDNGAILECVEQSLHTAGSMSIMTQEISVYYQVRNVVITIEPEMDSYKTGPNKHINLTCEADGNPAPEYRWYTETDMNNVIATGHILIMKNLNANQTGTYVCRAQHTINGKIHRDSAKVNITIEMHHNLPSHGDQTKSNGTVIAVVVLMVALVAVVVIFSYIYYRRRGNGMFDTFCLRLQNLNQHFRRKNVESTDKKHGGGESWAESERSSVRSDSNVELSPEYSSVVDVRDNATPELKPHIITKETSQYVDIDLANGTNGQRKHGQIKTVYTTPNADLVEQNKLTSFHNPIYSRKSSDIAALYTTINKVKRNTTKTTTSDKNSIISEKQPNIDNIDYADLSTPNSRPQSFVEGTKMALVGIDISDGDDKTITEDDFPTPPEKLGDSDLTSNGNESNTTATVEPDIPEKANRQSNQYWKKSNENLDELLKTDQDSDKPTDGSKSSVKDGNNETKDGDNGKRSSQTSQSRIPQIKPPKLQTYLLKPGRKESDM